jgi:hypothetical protein
LLAGNPCVSAENYRGRLIRSLPELQEIDETTISQAERTRANPAIHEKCAYLLKADPLNSLLYRLVDGEVEFEDAEDDDEDYYDYLKLKREERQQGNVTSRSVNKGTSKSKSTIVNSKSQVSSASGDLEQIRDDILKRSRARQQNMVRSKIVKPTLYQLVLLRHQMNIRKEYKL